MSITSSIFPSITNSITSSILGLADNAIPPIFSITPNCTSGWEPVKGLGAATFTRATSAQFTAYCPDDLNGNPVGTIRTADIDEPRFEMEGGLLEGEATNKLTYSNDFSSAYWSKTDITLATSAVISPAGIPDATKITSGGAGLLYRSVGADGDTKSIYARTVAGTGSVSLLKSNYIAESLFDLTEEWKRFDLTVDTSEGGGSFFYAVDFRGASTLTEVLIWQADLVALPFPTSPIYTEGTPVTRAASNLTYDAVGNFNPALFSIECEFSLKGLTSFNTILSINMSDGYFRLGVTSDGRINILYRNFGAGDASGGDFSVPININQTHKVQIIGGFGSDNTKITVDGVVESLGANTATATTLADMDVMKRTSSEKSYGNIKSLKIFDYDVTA